MIVVFGFIGADEVLNSVVGVVGLELGLGKCWSSNFVAVGEVV